MVTGGGISGLSAAYYLHRAGLPCVLIEPEPRLGGVIRTETVDGCVVESGPDGFLAQKPWASELVRDLGIEDQLIGSQDQLRKTYVVRGGRLTPLPEGLYLMVPTRLRPLLGTPLFSWAAKCRMMSDLLRWRPPRSARRDRSVAEFVREHFGREAVSYLAEPLLAGIYGGDAAELSAASVLPRFLEMESRYGSVIRGVLLSLSSAPAGDPAPLFLSLKRGMQQLVTALEEALGAGVTRIRAAVERIEKTPGGYRLEWAGGALEAGQVVLATPAYMAGAILRDLDGTLSQRLSEIRYHSSITLALGYDRAGFERPLDGFGFLAPKLERRLLTACTWVGTKFPHRVAPDRVLLRAFIGAGAEETLLNRPDEDLAAGVGEELRRLMGVTQAPLFTRISRSRRAMAQYTVGHGRRLEEIHARLARWPGLLLAGNAYQGIGVPDCIHSGKEAALRIVATSGH